MEKEPKYLYKCRNCGKIFDSGVRCNINMMRNDFIALVTIGETISQHAFSPTLLHTHLCNDDETGVADLISLSEK